MNTLARTVIAAALLASLAACGNKGALVRPSQIPAIQTPEEPAPQDVTPVLPATNPAAPVPQVEALPPPATDDGDDSGNG